MHSLFILIVAEGVSGHRVVLLVFLSQSHLSHLPPTRHAGRGRAPSRPKARLALTWSTPPTSATSLLRVPGRGSRGFVSLDVAAGGGGGRRGPECTAGEDDGRGDAAAASPATGWSVQARRGQRGPRVDIGRGWTSAAVGGAGVGVRPCRRRSRRTYRRGAFYSAIKLHDV